MTSSQKSPKNPKVPEAMVASNIASTLGMSLTPQTIWNALHDAGVKGQWTPITYSILSSMEVEVLLSGAAWHTHIIEGTMTAKTYVIVLGYNVKDYALK